MLKCVVLVRLEFSYRFSVPHMFASDSLGLFISFCRSETVAFDYAMAKAVETSPVDSGDDICVQDDEAYLTSLPLWMQNFVTKIVVPLGWNTWQSRLAKVRRRKTLLGHDFPCPRTFTTGAFYRQIMQARFGRSWLKALRRREHLMPMKKHQLPRKALTLLRKAVRLAKDLRNDLATHNTTQRLVPCVQNLLGELSHSIEVLSSSGYPDLDSATQGFSASTA